MPAPDPLLADHLHALDADGLALLLRRRPDVLGDPLPTTLSALAERLDHPMSVATLLRSAPLPVLQAAEALAALGGRAPRQRLLRLLGMEEAHPAAPPATAAPPTPAATAVIDWMRERVIVRLEGGDDGRDAQVVVGSPSLGQIFASPLEAGRPLRDLAKSLTAEAAKGVLRELGVRAPTPRGWNKSTATAALAEALGDPERVRAIAAAAPAEVSEWLLERAWGEGATHGYDRARYQLEQKAGRWALMHGLVFGDAYGYGVTMPAEVALALRGPGYHAPFSPQAPQVTLTEVSGPQVEVESTAAATLFSGQATAVLDRVRAHGVPTLKSGGVGARELTRLAQATAASPAVVRLVLELAEATRVIEEDETGVVVSEHFAAWRDIEPGERHASLVAVWWVFGGVPSQDRFDGKVVPALRADHDCGGCIAGRHALAQALADLPAGQGTDVASIGPAALWSRPLVHASTEEGEAPFTRAWHEGELLGVVARGALAPLGHALLAADADRLVELACEIVPGTVDDAVFGTDSTAVVTGTPSARVTNLLDRCADRESRGAGVVWRLTPGSVRRALDEGLTGEQLQERLTAISRGELPQALRFLIGDVARRHGSLRVRDVAAIVRSDDTALLAQAAADRSLRSLGLSLLAPTVLASSIGQPETVAALRAAGYLPMPEDDGGAVLVTASPQDRTPCSPAALDPAGLVPVARAEVLPARRVDVEALAAKLAKSGSRGRPVPPRPVP